MKISTRQFGSDAGSSLLELALATGVAGLVMGGVLSSFIFCTRSFMAMGNYMDLDRASLVALDTMSRDIREAKSLQSYATNQLVFIDVSSNSLTYAWSPSTGLFTRTSGTTNTVLLKQCDYLSFNISQRTPLTNGVFGFYPATNTPALCKMVSVSWRCSRSIMGGKENTESVQTAKIVMRN